MGFDYYKYVVAIQKDIDGNLSASDCYSIEYADGHNSLGSTFCPNTTEIAHYECRGMGCAIDEGFVPNCEECHYFTEMISTIKKDYNIDLQKRV